LGNKNALIGHDRCKCFSNRLAEYSLFKHYIPKQLKGYCQLNWLYYRFNLSHRDIEDLLAERGITVSREAIRLWCIKFGAIYTRRLKRKHRGYGDTFFIDEVFAEMPDQKINGKQHYLWRAVDQDGEVVDVYLQAKRDGPAVTTRQLSASSKDYCAVMVLLIGN
jgi:transposase-like protein